MLEIGEFEEQEDGSALVQVHLDGKDEQLILYHGMTLLVEEFNKTSESKVKVLPASAADKFYAEEHNPPKTFELDDELYASLVQLSIVDMLKQSLKKIEKEELEYGHRAGEEVS